ncbi:MAG: FAD-dependent oxidoreductase [Bacteroidota bacterium]|nr:FAD-dependent oxidoreductase [Bacteroidota bacterium]
MRTIKASKNKTNVNISYWETDRYLGLQNLVVIGSGIVGLFTALNYKKQNPTAKVTVLERGVLPFGASTKNAGFACFGSLTELLQDMKTIPEKQVWETVCMRTKGLEILRKTLGDKAIDYRAFGGYELFDDPNELEKCVDKIPAMNEKMRKVIGERNCYALTSSKIKTFGFKNAKGLILNRCEGQIDTGKMMESLMNLVRKNNITILNGITVTNIFDTGSKAIIETNIAEFSALKVVVAINGFAKQLLNIKDVNPARAQVLITKPIKGLKIKGSFHYQQGYYYFRNINNRLLFGGARNLDIKGETSTDFKITSQIQKDLEKKLKHMILPNTPFEIDQRWAGIMGVGSEKKPIIKHVSKNVIAAVRMGGMGVAIGSLVGKEAAELAGD